jgi:hypothetical protein
VFWSRNWAAGTDAVPTIVGLRYKAFEGKSARDRACNPIVIDPSYVLTSPSLRLGK